MRCNGGVDMNTQASGEWKYPAGVIQPSECELGRFYVVKFLDDDWDFTIPGDSKNQPVKGHQARREQTELGVEWFVVGVERWTYRDDELLIVGDCVPVTRAAPQGART
ncbi:MAG: hypothetical protein K0U78_20120 [Actinomycetia bacterium]|nr:hypothetical protein [Actinomycetes bacterium]